MFAGDLCFLPCENVYNTLLTFYVFIVQLYHMKSLRVVMAFLSNRYWLAVTAFAVWVIFFDESNLFVQRQRTRELNELNKKIGYYDGLVRETSLELKDLQNDPAMLEKYAREKYYMKRDNEEVFVVDSAGATLVR
jgi:cell division protein DivIC